MTTHKRVILYYAIINVNHQWAEVGICRVEDHEMPYLSDSNTTHCKGKN